MRKNAGKIKGGTIVLTVILAIVIIACGFCIHQDNVREAAIEKEDYKITFKSVFYNSDLDWAFEIYDESGSGQMARYSWGHNGGINYAPKIFRDVPSDQKPWAYIKARKVIEIHLHKDSKISTGAENRGKFGIHKWSELDIN